MASFNKPRTHFRVGSRKSKLAMAQTEHIIECLSKVNPTHTFEIVNFDTVGDKILDKALAKIGDKGLFTKELEEALLNGSIDFVVHSLKDMPCQTLPENLIIGAIPIREDPHDAVVMSRNNNHFKTLDDLPDNSVVGTSSLRRVAQLKSKYPKLKFENIRGNLNTRFKKLDDDAIFDAIILAVAGLKRLNFKDRITHKLPPSICMHAVSQGALGVECRLDDEFVIKMLNELNDEETVLRCVAERAFMAFLNGGCTTPIAVNSSIINDRISLEGLVLSLNGESKIQGKFETKLDGLIDTTDCCPITLIGTDTDTNHNDGNNKKSPTSYTYVVANNIDHKKMIKAEFCGIHLGQMLLAKGADVLIEKTKIEMRTN